MALSKVLCRGAPCQGLVSADGVVDALPVAQGLTGAGQIQVPVVPFPELLGMGVPWARSTWPLSLRPGGPQPEGLGERGGRRKRWTPASRQASSNWAMNSEPPSTLRLRSGQALHSPKLKREPLLKLDQGGGGCTGGSSGVDPYGVPAGDGVAGGELLEDHAWQGAQVKGVYLHEIAWGLRPVALRFPGPVGTPGASPAGGEGASWWFPQ